MDQQQEFLFQQPTSCFADADFDMFDNNGDQVNLFNMHFYNNNNQNQFKPNQDKHQFQEDGVYYDHQNESYNNNNSQKINNNGQYFPYGDDDINQINHNYNQQQNQQEQLQQEQSQLLQNTYDYSSNLNSSQTESFINQNNNNNINVINNEQEFKEQQQQIQQKPIHQKMSIKEKVKLRKQKIQYLNKLKELREDQVIPTKQLKEEVVDQDINNQQESQSTDIEKMAEESHNNDKESSHTTDTTKKLSKKINKKKDKNVVIENNNLNSQSDDEQPLDKRSQQKIKNRISAQKSRDEKKKQMSNLIQEVDELKVKINILENENIKLKNQLSNNNLCSKCSQSISSSPSTDDSSESEQNYIQEESFQPQNYFRSNYLSNYNNIHFSSVNLAIVLLICFLGISVYQNNASNFMNQSQNIAIGFNQLPQQPQPLYKQNNNVMQSNSCNINQNNEQILDDQNNEQHSLKVYEDYGIDVNSLQLQSTLIDNKLINTFAQPSVSIESNELAQIVEDNYNNGQRDQILCPKATVIVSEKDDINSKYTLVDVAINMNQTQYLQQVDGKLIPVFNSGGRGIQILTCVVAKSEITNLSTDLIN